MKTLINKRTLIGEVILSLLAISGLIRTIFIQKNIVITLVLSLLFVFLIISVIFKLKNTTYKEESLSINLIYAMANLIVSSFLVYSFHNYLNIHFLIMVPIVGLVGALFINKFENALYIGAFIGMTSVGIGYFSVIVVISALLYSLIENAYSGYGGKLGSSAFFAGVFIAIFAKNEILVTYTPVEVYLIIIAAVISALLTGIIQRHYNLSTVLSSAFVGLIGSIFLLIPNFSYGTLITSVILGASFIGMTTKENLKLNYLLVVALLFSFLIIYLPFGGIGGKLGFTAFLSVLIVKGISNLLDPYLNKINSLKRRN